MVSNEKNAKGEKESEEEIEYRKKVKRDRSKENVISNERNKAKERMVERKRAK